MKVFFSHSSRDKALVRDIRRNLPDHFAAWIDENDLLIGTDISDSIQRAIRADVDFVVIFLSSNAISSEWVKHELEWALQREKSLKRTFVIPVLLDDVWTHVEPTEFQQRLYLRCFDQSESQVKFVANRLYDEVVKLLFKNVEDVAALKARLESTLNSLSELVRAMTSDERRLFRLISLQPGKGLELTSSFERDSDFHATLRGLRDRGIIQPTERGTWKPGKHVRVTEIGRSLLHSDRFRELMVEEGMPKWWRPELEGPRLVTE